MADGVKLLNDERNAMVHSAWKKGPRHGVMTRIWPRVIKGRWEAKSMEVVIEVLDEVADLIEEASKDAVQISVALASVRRMARPAVRVIGSGCRSTHP